MIMLCSSFSVLNWSIKQVGDAVLACCCIVVDVIILIRIVHETAGNRLAATGIGFLYIPIIFILLIIVWLTTFKRKTDFKVNKSKKENNENGVSNQNEKESYESDDHKTPIELKPIQLHFLD